MRDHVVLAKHQETGLWHALLYRNHPTPSGCDRPILKLSTTVGQPTEEAALLLMKDGLDPEYARFVDFPKLKAAP